MLKARRFRDGRRRRSGAFTLIEVIVALAVILILAAVALPQVSGFLDQKKVEAAATQLAQVRDALYRVGAGNTAFFQTVGANARRLSQLTIPLINGDLNSCGGTFNGGQRNNWDNGGPFLNFGISATTGMATPIGLADDLLTRTPAGGGGASGTLRITWTNTVTLDDATNLDVYVDGVAGWNVGTVQWTPQLGTNGVVTLHYFVLIDGTC